MSRLTPSTWKKVKSIRSAAASPTIVTLRYLCSFSATMQWFVHEKSQHYYKFLRNRTQKKNRKKSSNYRALEAFQMITWLHDEIRKKTLYNGDNILLNFWVRAWQVWTRENKKNHEEVSLQKSSSYLTPLYSLWKKIPQCLSVPIP